MSVATVDPSTGTLIEAFEPPGRAELGAAIQRGHRSFLRWRRLDVGRRCDHLRELAVVLRARRVNLSVTMAREMGKPVFQGEAEIDRCAEVCEFYARHAAEFLASRPVGAGAARSEVVHRPLGLVLGVMPWNEPFWQVFRFAAPALAAGNACLLKHASNVPRCALAIERLCAAAGVPEGVFQTLLTGSDAVRGLIEHPLVRGVTFTGTAAAGSEVAEAAGKAIKPSVLELGGSDPYLILEDADLELAADACVTSRLENSGQSCTAAKRFIVVEPVREAFEALVVERMRRARMQPPTQPSCELGPLASVAARDALHDQVRASVALGASCLLGGYVPRDLPGAYYPPTVLTRVVAGMPAFSEELFGPVAAIVPVVDAQEAIEVANTGSFGLGAAVFTRDVERGWQIARDELEAGSCFVNDRVRSDPRLPCGGIKDSGYGRELGRQGILAFVNVKTVYAA
ncbi:MAG: NAD-dependent succinate-semialdehyde dehydrogenase [Planctomycetota bacterium]